MKNIEKTIVFALIAIAFTSCNEQNQVDRMLANDQTKQDIFKGIVNNYDIMKEFTETMKNTV